MSSGEYERLAGRYRVVSRLGRGGMGVVWRAFDEVLGREVAVKELRAYNDVSGPELDGLRLRMQREARAAARVRHPGVVAVHDVTEHEGRPVIVMELVDGPSLDGVLRQRGALEPREAAAIGAAVLEALAAAHDAGVLHRDVKPGNILLAGGERSGTGASPAEGWGRVVLTDFGIAAMDDPDDGSATHLTRSGEIVGSLDYLAPERAQGHQPGPASDVWALGATLYAAVEGSSPFRRTSTWSTLNAIVVEPLPEARRAGPLGPVLRQLLHKDPAERPDARTAARLLAAVAEGRDTPAAGAPSAAPAAPPVAPTAPFAQSTSQSASPTAQGTPPVAPAAPAHLWVPTEPSAVPHRAEGFGPAVPPAQPGPGVPPWGEAPAPYAGAGAPTRRTERSARKRSTALVAAAAAAVLLIGGGVTYGLIDRGGAAQQDQAAGGQSPTGPGGEGDQGRALDPGSPGASAIATGTPSASGTPSKEGAKTSAPPSPSPSRSTATKAPVPGGAGGGTATGGGSGGSTGGTGATSGGSGGTGGGSTTTGGGGSAPQPEAACSPRGGGAYDCQVWRTGKTYSHGGNEMGVLNAGTNYFYCQVDLGRRETYGQWTNVWWARTDDDSGNTNVYFSVVYIKGGDNDRPLPGLPVC
ncbi:serine/threonine-protein kinase [Streptomyces sp. NPDC020422]|uniref:serine/threonine-protein kinase n=1 Tax=Streptomyces sp. NPDC020422 TaxID=3365074 RepID=UPI0037924002